MLEGFYRVQGKLCTARYWEVEIAAPYGMTVWFKPVDGSDAATGMKLIRVVSTGRDAGGSYVLPGVETFPEDEAWDAYVEACTQRDAGRIADHAAWMREVEEAFDEITA